MTTRSAAQPFWETFYSTFFDDPIYDAFYGGSGFANFGDWSSGATSAADASRALVQRIAQPLLERPGATLDVGCGVGASTAYLSEAFYAVTGINFDPGQIERARKRFPDQRFEVMDATQLSFEANTFANLISVEAAFHFRTRERFLQEALRVLEPGGQLAMSDLLMARGAPLWPAENHLRGIAEYRALLERIGFEAVEVTDITDATWRPYRKALTRFVAARTDRWATLTGLRDLYTINVNSAWAIRACVLVHARKPEGAHRSEL